MQHNLGQVPLPAACRAGRLKAEGSLQALGTKKFKSILGNSGWCLEQLKVSNLWIGRCGPILSVCLFVFLERGLKKQNTFTLE